MVLVEAGVILAYFPSSQRAGFLGSALWEGGADGCREVWHTPRSTGENQRHAGGAEPRIGFISESLLRHTFYFFIKRI